MEINKIRLPVSVVADLYTSSLIMTEELITAHTKTNQTSAINENETSLQPKGLGENKKNILITVKCADAVHITDKELNFLTAMLSACKLTLADVVIVNLAKQDLGYKELLPFFNSRVCLLFDVEPGVIGLPINFPFFQIQPFSNCSFLYSPSLSELENDKVQKSKLWVCLKRLFNL